MSEKPKTVHEAFVWFTRLDDPHRIVVHDILADRIKELEAENERLRDCIRWLEPDVKDIDAWMEGSKGAIQKVKELRTRGTP